MPTSFPGALDTFANPTEGDALNTPGVEHHDQHADVNDAVEALQATVGITGSANAGSIQYRLANIDGGTP